MAEFKKGSRDTVKLVSPVKCEGLIEEWLLKLEKAMKRTVKDRIKKMVDEIDGL